MQKKLKEVSEAQALTQAQIMSPRGLKSKSNKLLKLPDHDSARRQESSRRSSIVETKDNVSERLSVAEPEQSRKQP